MDAGKLQHKLTVFFRGVESNPLGEAVENPLLERTQQIWGRIEPLGGQELFSARQIHPLVTHKITMRPVTGLTVACRLEYLGHRFNVLAVIDRLERGEYWSVMATEEADV